VDVLFKDVFSDSTSGWGQISDEAGSTGYLDGVYHISVNLPGHKIWSNPGLSFTDTTITVEASKVDGPDDNFFGIICRYQDPKNYYFFIISSDGYYGIGRMIGGEQSLIGLESMHFSRDIQQGVDSNLLRADCVGDSLGFYINDNFIIRRRDTSFASGDIGLIAGTFEEAGVEIQFKNLLVRSPQD
jgi:hypothetical protein